MNERAASRFECGHPLTALPANSRVTQYEQGAMRYRTSGVRAGLPETHFDTARTVRELIAGQVVSLTHRVVERASDGGAIVHEDRCNDPNAQPGDVSCLRTTTVHYAESEDAITDAMTSGRVRSVTTPDGQLTSLHTSAARRPLP